MSDAPANVPTPDAELARRLGNRLWTLGLSEPKVLEVFGIREAAQFRMLPPALVAQRTGEPTGLNTVIRLFLLGVGSTRAAAEQAFGDIPLSDLFAAGILRDEGERVMGAIQLFVQGGVISAGDLPRAPGQAQSDIVMGVSGATLFLGNLLLRRKVGDALEIGAGCGMLAAVAAGFADRVIATDINPRATAYARLTAALNGRTNVECLTGDLYTPAQGRTFDLIYSNPPYVISPERTFVYRDSGVRGDEFCRRLIAEGAGLLNPRGVLQVTCDVPLSSPQDLQPTLSRWLAESGCDALVHRFRTVDALSYAQQWIGTEAQERGISDPEALNAKVRTWMEFFQQQRIGGVAHVLITLRKLDPWEASAGRQPWMRVDDTPDRVGPGAGEQIWRIFEGMDFLAGASDQKLLAARFRAAPDVRLRQDMRLGEQGWGVSEANIRLEGGLNQGASAAPGMVQMLMLCDGRRTGADIVQQMANAARQPVERAGPATMQALRGLIERGLIGPAA